MLPKLARLAAIGLVAEFRRGFRRLLQAVVLVGAIGTVGAFLIGPFVLRVLFDSHLSRRTLTLLALASAVYMVALALAQAIIALRGHAWVALGWASGMAAFLAVLTVAGDDLLLRVELALLAGSCMALLMFAIILRARLASGATPDEESIVEALYDLPLNEP